MNACSLNLLRQSIRSVGVPRVSFSLNTPIQLFLTDARSHKSVYYVNPPLQRLNSELYLNSKIFFLATICYYLTDRLTLFSSGSIMVECGSTSVRSVKFQNLQNTKYDKLNQLRQIKDDKPTQNTLNSLEFNAKRH